MYPQFEAWIDNFIPVENFGFAKGTGPDDYGMYIGSVMMKTLEERKEGLLIPLDVKGVFDRVWWARLKRRLEDAGLCGKALDLIKDYLSERFIQVVVNGVASTLREIHSSVPQGGKPSPKLWNFDIRNMGDAVQDDALFMAFVDDCNIWFEVTQADRDSPAHLFCLVNEVLDRLSKRGIDNSTTFEPEKIKLLVISNWRIPFDRLMVHSTGIVFEGCPVQQVESAKVVGFTFDSKPSYKEMIDEKAKKARGRIAALRKLSGFLNQACGK